jgi:hypothetical protein
MLIVDLSIVNSISFYNGTSLSILLIITKTSTIRIHCALSNNQRNYHQWFTCSTNHIQVHDRHEHSQAESFKIHIQDIVELLVMVNYVCLEFYARKRILTNIEVF